jgi:hypothetical protein
MAWQPHLAVQVLLLLLLLLVLLLLRLVGVRLQRIPHQRHRELQGQG